MELKRNTAYKLSNAQVAEIIALYGQGFTQGSIARHFGVSAGQVGRIVRGESRTDVVHHRGPTQAEIDASEARMKELHKMLESGQMPQAVEKKEERIDPFAPGAVYGPKAGVTPPKDPLDELGDA